jgi:hypothetical protein
VRAELRRRPCYRRAAWIAEAAVPQYELLIVAGTRPAAVTAVTADRKPERSPRVCRLADFASGRSRARTFVVA